MVESIDIKILDRVYTIACTKDEEARVKNLSSLLEKKAIIIREKYGQLPERNLLFMIGLMIADEAFKVHTKKSDFENTINQLQNKINLMEQSKDKQNQEATLKVSEITYMLEKILNRIQQINISLKSEIEKLSNNTNETETDDDKTI